MKSLESLCRSVSERYIWRGMSLTKGIYPHVWVCYIVNVLHDDTHWIYVHVKFTWRISGAAITEYIVVVVIVCKLIVSSMSTRIVLQFKISQQNIKVSKHLTYICIYNPSAFLKIKNLKYKKKKASITAAKSLQEQYENDVSIIKSYKF